MPGLAAAGAGDGAQSGAGVERAMAAFMRPSGCVRRPRSAAQILTVRPPGPAGGRVTAVTLAEAAGGQPALDLVVEEAEPAVPVLGAQELQIVRREVDDQQPPAGRHQPRRLGDRGGRLAEVVQHLVDDHEVGLAAGQAGVAGCRRGAARRRRRPALGDVGCARCSASAARDRGRRRSWPFGPAGSACGRCRCPRSTSRRNGPSPAASRIAASTAASET